MATSLSSLRRGPRVRPPRVVLAGTPAIGKSTWANSAPSPIFIPTEDGLDAIDVHAAFDVAESLQDVLDAIGVLINQDHDFKTVVLDSADWLERLVHKQVAAAHKVTSIEGIPYGKGYKLAAEEWRSVIEGLDILRNVKRMNVIVIAHVKIKRFDDPTSDSYDRYILDMHEGVSSILIEWCDVLGFVQHDVTMKTTEGGFNKKIIKGIGSGERILHLEERPGFLAKNRYGMPPSIPFPKVDGWSTFENVQKSSMQQTNGE
jgi:hypothetical protein